MSVKDLQYSGCMMKDPEYSGCMLKDPEYLGCLVKDPKYSGGIVKDPEYLRLYGDSSLIELRTTDLRSAFYFAVLDRLTFRISCRFA